MVDIGVRWFPGHQSFHLAALGALAQFCLRETERVQVDLETKSLENDSLEKRIKLKNPLGSPEKQKNLGHVMSEGEKTGATRFWSSSSPFVQRCLGISKANNKF